MNSRQRRKVRRKYSKQYSIDTIDWEKCLGRFKPFPYQLAIFDSNITKVSLFARKWRNHLTP